jgi:hypothetical protein
MVIAIFSLLLTIFPYALFALCNPNCCPKPGTFGIFPITLHSPMVITVTNTLEFYKEPCKTTPSANTIPLPPGTTITLSGSGSFVTEGQCLPYSKGETSVWFITTQGYFFTGDTNIFDLHSNLIPHPDPAVPAGQNSGRCYCHIRYSSNQVIFYCFRYILLISNYSFFFCKLSCQ